MHALNTVTPRYDPVEDRILLAINAGKEDAWACWLTRRMTLGALSQLNQYLDKTSTVAARTPLEYRSEVSAMERAAAVATTRSALSKTSDEQLTSVAAHGELATELNLTPQGDKFVFDIRGRQGGHARGLVSRAELQTILLMIEQEAVKSGWVPAAPTPPAPEPGQEQAVAAAKKRRAN